MDAFKRALLAPTHVALEDVTWPELTYGHATGAIESRATFIDNTVAGMFFLSITWSAMHMEVCTNVAWVRHRMQAELRAGNAVDLDVLVVWHKRADVWRILARQAKFR